ncbi:protein phosphatase 2C domain-containing protein [Hyphomonas sp.]|uniref:protein phosphatase 2C domain-containing protein n=1 Tax=Hyphomonas sp. TaxID=87 RepID=UPI001D4E934F|nr:protein phosphatase 2C domain-containing protein [Hyphomonas sp.]MBU3919633.1 protein phosphatase 2C domain-containing protein [Alphaproteobacteria bacterium]MBU4060734.1 protein phosphatase 2C domain-containing protein [Alphaproteobacteria bacterium]MBU4164718.1 protein phosphatase 2C domain-containing protein [Alphaproteobacteria bacterium]
MVFAVLDTVNDPGTPGKSGDDRYGFDAAAGRAWVIDGATDATDLKPFPGAESGAAWLADTVSARLMSGPDAGEGAKPYFGRVLTDVAADAARRSKIPLHTLPGEAMPIASAMWMRRDGDACEFVWAGDCFAVAQTAGGEARLIGTQEKADAETRDAARMLALPLAERWAILQAQRRGANAPERGLITLNPAAAQHLQTERLVLTPGSAVLLMTDGFFRFVEPYGLDTPASLLARVLKEGLGGALGALRDHETTPRGVRLKARDDAAAVLLRV